MFCFKEKSKSELGLNKYKVEEFTSNIYIVN